MDHNCVCSVTPGTHTSPALFAKGLDSTLSIDSMMSNQNKAEAMRPSNPADLYRQARVSETPNTLHTYKVDQVK